MALYRQYLFRGIFVLTDRRNLKLINWVYIVICDSVALSLIWFVLTCITMSLSWKGIALVFLYWIEYWKILWLAFSKQCIKLLKTRIYLSQGHLFRALFFIRATSITFSFEWEAKLEISCIQGTRNKLAMVNTKFELAAIPNACCMSVNW